MIPRPANLAATPARELPSLSDRRAYLRYPRRFEMLWQRLGLAGRDQIPARVINVSAGGVGLVSDRPLVLESLLVLRLPTATAGWVSHLVRVKRCDRQEDGAYQVGCAFVKPLSRVQLRVLLG